MREFLLAMMLAFVALPAWSREAAPAADDPAIEQRMSEIASELRCLVCQNQTILESSAPLAVDLRNDIRDQLKQGKSAREIMDFMVARYGDFVLYRPPLKGSTLLLWLGPLLLVLTGLVVMFRKIARRRAESAALTNEEHEAAAKLLAGGESGQ